jgi:hypothetical protein
MAEWELNVDWERSGHGPIGTLSKHLIEVTEENHAKYQLGYQVSRSAFETSISRINKQTSLFGTAL